MVLIVALSIAPPLKRREVARHTLIVVVATVSAVLVPPIALLVLAVLPLALLVALVASLVDLRAAITGLALTVALTPVISHAGELWAGEGGPHLQSALRPMSVLIAVTCAALATRSRRSTAA